MNRRQILLNRNKIRELDEHPVVQGVFVIHLEGHHCIRIVMVINLQVQRQHTIGICHFPEIPGLHTSDVPVN
jgi:hypothetical protein